MLPSRWQCRSVLGRALSSSSVTSTLGRETEGDGAEGAGRRSVDTMPLTAELSSSRMEDMHKCSDRFSCAAMRDEVPAELHTCRGTHMASDLKVSINKFVQ